MAKYGLFKYGLAKYGLVGTVFTPVWSFKNRISNENQNYRICKVEILDKNDILIKQIPDEDFISLDTNYVSQNGVRRTATLTLLNEDNKYTPKYRGIWIQTRFACYSGQVVNGVEKLYSRGIYCITSVQINDSVDIPTITFNLEDKYSLLSGTLAGTLPTDIIIDRDIPISTVIKNVLNMSSDKQAPLITNTSVKTFYTLTAEAGDSLDDLIKPLAETIAYSYGYNSHGRFVFHPSVVDETMEYSNAASVYDFNKDDVNFIESSRNQDFTKVKNSIIVIGENLLGNLVRSEITDNYIFSTTRKEYIEERTKVIYDKNIFSQDLADTRSKYELFVSIRIQEQVDIVCNVIDYINENNIITIQSDEGIQERYLVNSVGYSSTNDTMTISVWKIRTTI